MYAGLVKGNAALVEIQILYSADEIRKARLATAMKNKKKVSGTRSGTSSLGRSSRESSSDRAHARFHSSGAPGPSGCCHDETESGSSSPDPGSDSENVFIRASSNQCKTVALLPDKQQK